MIWIYQFTVKKNITIGTWREFSFKIYLKNIVGVIQYNILKIFTMHLGKIKLILYFIVVLLTNEREIYIKILLNTMLSHDYNIFRINSKKKFFPCNLDYM